MNTERQQSAVNTACRISRRFSVTGRMYSCGSVERARISAEDMKSLKKRVGKRAKSIAIPPVSPKLMYTALMRFVSSDGSSTIFFSASMASNGMVNSAMTRIDATVRNLEYIGT